MVRKNREWHLGSIAGLAVTATPAALAGFLALWLLATWVVARLRRVRVGWALRAGTLIAVVHFASELLHQLGHAAAAGRTGYPMAGVRFGLLGVLATSIYPEDEPELPAAVHIRRALGGPIVSVAIGLAAGLILALTRGAGGMGRLTVNFICLENLLLFGLGAFVPLGFTDGSTILHHWR